MSWSASLPRRSLLDSNVCAPMPDLTLAGRLVNEIVSFGVCSDGNLEQQALSRKCLSLCTFLQPAAVGLSHGWDIGTGLFTVVLAAVRAYLTHAIPQASSQPGCEVAPSLKAVASRLSKLDCVFDRLDLLEATLSDCVRYVCFGGADHARASDGQSQ